ncbi:MarR family winged helix-turn-helix transcriptional regulator [Micromonospora sp. CA-259024]|uniref:MarR family winged helix-turn-helix transcriptional regulator n=1 Tax=Micromonospora sp. CA-259024 TaxID=3239965 RepID=UPI003D8B50F7
MAGIDPCELSADRTRGSTFGWSLGLVLRRWQEIIEETLKDLPHGSRGYHLLAVVVHEEVPTQGALAARLVIDRSVLTYVIDDLENAGLIRRQLDPRDRRARRIVATDRGRQALAEAERRVTQAEDHVLGGLPEKQRHHFRDLAARAAEAIHTAAPGTDPCAAVSSVLPQTEQSAQ